MPFLPLFGAAAGEPPPEPVVKPWRRQSQLGATATPSRPYGSFAGRAAGTSVVAAAIGSYEAGAGPVSARAVPFESVASATTSRAVGWESLQVVHASGEAAWSVVTGVTGAGTGAWESASIGITASALARWEALGPLVVPGTAPWAALVGGLRSGTTAAWSVLTGIGTVAIRPWESASGAAVVMTGATIPWEALRRLASSGSVAWESTVPVTMARMSGIEALIARRRSATPGLDGLAGRTAVSHAAWGALAPAAASATRPWESSVTLVVVSTEATVLWEALHGVRHGSPASWDALSPFLEPGDIIVIAPRDQAVILVPRGAARIVPSLQGSRS